MLPVTAGPRTIAALVDAAAHRTPTKIALKALQQLEQGTTGTACTTATTTTYTYEQLSETTNKIAAFLSLYGYERNDVLVSDLPNTSENLLIQLACNRLGVVYGTTKSIERMSKQFTKVKGAVVADATTSFLSSINLPLPYLGNDYLSELINTGGLNDFAGDTYDVDDDTDDNNAGNHPHGLYNTSVPYTNEQAIQHGKDAAFHLSMSSDDVVCVAITLCHPFGIGSAICSTLYAGGTIVLPATISGIIGCGIPSQRSLTTFDALRDERCTLLFADTHTMRSLDEGVKRPNGSIANQLEPVEPSDLPMFRGGVCKVGSGSKFLKSTIKFAGVSMKTMGKEEY
jgi:AMP-binding enzyme